MRIMSFNANGLRSAASKGFFDWFNTQNIDILCVQETKAQTAQLQTAAHLPPGYHAHFRDATCKKGYSGVAIYSRRAPDSVLTALGWDAFDEEGRYIEARFGNLSVVSLYLPSGSSGQLRQDFKEQVMAWFAPILQQWLHSGRDYVLCGDWNIVRSAKDIKNWKGNQKNSGCLPHERAWLSGLIDDVHHDGASMALSGGWKDSYRIVHPDGEDYTWWSQRGQARANNVGWRIDYQLITPALARRVQNAEIAATPKFSDHAPYTVTFS